MKATTELPETQKFFIGEKVAYVTANNVLAYGEVIEPTDEFHSEDRVRVRKANGDTCSPTRDRVAHL